MMIPIQYTIGDATHPQGPGNRKIIAHVCNTDGAWGAGFVLALNKVSLEPMKSYRRWWEEGQSRVPKDAALGGGARFQLGSVKLAAFEPEEVFVANMLAQTLAKGVDGIPLSYTALTLCLAQLRLVAGYLGASVHMPRIGCGLAGGDWAKVERTILMQVSAWNVPVTVYDLLPPPLTLED